MTISIANIVLAPMFAALCLIGGAWLFYRIRLMLARRREKLYKTAHSNKMPSP